MPDRTYLLVTVINIDEPQYESTASMGWFCSEGRFGGGVLAIGVGDLSLPISMV